MAELEIVPRFVAEAASSGTDDKVKGNMGTLEFIESFKNEVVNIPTDDFVLDYATQDIIDDIQRSVVLKKLRKMKSVGAVSTKITYRSKMVTSEVKTLLDEILEETGFVQDWTNVAFQNDYDGLELQFNTICSDGKILLFISWNRDQYDENGSLAISTIGGGLPSRVAEQIKAAGFSTNLGKLKDDTKFSVGNAFFGNHGVRTNTKSFKKIPFDSIKGNYTKQCQDDLGQLIERLPNFENGFVILNGPPGTGKTYFIRSLLSEMASIRSGMICTPSLKFVDDVSALYNVFEEEKKYLMILEDVGDLLAVTSKTENMQGFTNLLNFGDGLIGDIFNTIFVLTFNYEVSEIDPAVLRSGRCIANITIPPFRIEEAIKQFPEIEKELNEEADSHVKEITLSDIYQVRNTGTRSVIGESNSKRHKPGKLGF